MNERWERNLPNIIALEKKIEDLHKQLDNVTLENEITELTITIEDYENEIVGLKTSFYVVI